MRRGCIPQSSVGKSAAYKAASSDACFGPNCLCKLAHDSIEWKG